MPRVAIDYSKNVIYKLICCDPNVTEFYVGSTVNFRNRKSLHKTACTNSNNKAYNQKKYQIIRANGGWENWRMVQIEHFPCNNSRESEAREQHFIDTLNATLNSIKSFCTETEHKEYQKQYQIEHKDEIKDYQKQYYQDNKDEIRKQQKQYRTVNNEKIKQQANKKYDCDCGGKYTVAHKTRHLKSQLHQNYLKQFREKTI